MLRWDPFGNSFLEESLCEPDLGATAPDDKGGFSSYNMPGPRPVSHEHILLNPPVQAPSLYYNSGFILQIGKLRLRAQANMYQRPPRQ